LKNAHGKDAQVSSAVSKASASHVRSGNSAQLPSAKQDSKEREQDSNVNIRWREVQCDVIQTRQALNEEERVLNNRKKELCEKEAVLVNMLQNTVYEEQQARTRVEKELNQARISFNELNERLQHELVEIRQALDDEVRLRDTSERQLKEKERFVDELCSRLFEQQQMRRRLEEERQQTTGFFEERLRILELQMQEEKNRNSQLQSAVSAAQQELQRKENANREQQTASEERLRNLELQMQEERNRNLSHERELQSAVSAAQEELAEYQRRQPQDWIIQREEVLLSDDVLGNGAWGSVRQGKFRGCQVAVKEIHEIILSPHNRRLFEREMSIASCCRHPNLLQFIGATNDDGSPLFVTEKLDTSLRRLLSQRALSDEEIVSLALDVAKGLNYLHLNRPLPIIHRDISSANVLLWRRDEDWRAKLSDYGSANFMRQCMTVSPGAITYSAPEALTSQQSPKLDVYSFGVLLCEMCIRELPDPDPQGIHNQIRQVTNGNLQKLIKRCVKINPEERPTISEVISQLEGHSRSKGILTRMRTLLKV